MNVYISNSEKRSSKQLERVISTIEGVRSAAFFPYGENDGGFFEQFNPNILIMDNIVNGIFDLDLLERAEQTDTRMLKIIYTGIANKKYQLICKDFGIDHFVYKDAGTEYLRFVINDYIAERREATSNFNNQHF